MFFFGPENRETKPGSLEYTSVSAPDTSYARTVLARGPRLLASGQAAERLICDTTTLTESEITNRVRNAVLELAAQGKRVALPPKCFADGIVIDWVYDRSVKQEDSDSILRGVVPVLKDEMHSSRDRSVYFPAVDRLTGSAVDDNLVTTGTSSSHRESHIISSSRQVSEPVTGNIPTAPYRRCVSENTFTGRRRRRSSCGGQFTLTNLAHGTEASEVRTSLQRSGIPENGITEVRIRASPVGTIAIVHVADGYDAASLEQMVRRGNSGIQPRGTSRTPVIVDLVSDKTDAEPDAAVMCAAPDMHVRSVEEAEDRLAEMKETKPVDCTVSPALSYLTLEEHRSEDDDPNDVGVDADLAHGQVREHTLSPYSRFLALHSSDQESGEDLPHENTNFGHAATIEHDEDATERLLHGQITAVRSFLQDASNKERQYMELLSSHASSAAGPSDRSLRADDSDSDSDTHTGQQPNWKRHDRNAKRHAARRRKGDSNGHSGAAVPKPTTDASPSIDSGSVSVTLPKPDHAKGRRLVVPADPSLPIAAVYMRGDCQFIHQETRKHIARFSLPAQKARRDIVPRHVVDAVSLDEDTAVIGYDKGSCQVSCLLLNADRPRHVDLTHRGHTTVVEHHTGTSSPNPGISALAAMPADGRSRRFLSGGGDGIVRLWTLSGEGHDGLQAGSAPLELSPRQPVRGLAFRASDGAVLVGHARHVSVAPLEAPTRATPALLSAAPLQVHVHPQNPRVVLIEVDHLDRQVQIFDVRSANLDRRPVMEFGHRAAPSIGPAKHIYRRGSTSHALFARGYGDGTLCVWDFRNTSSVTLKTRTREDPIVHAVLHKDQVIAYGAYRVNFWSLADF